MGIFQDPHGMMDFKKPVGDSLEKNEVVAVDEARRKEMTDYDNTFEGYRDREWKNYFGMRTVKKSEEGVNYVFVPNLFSISPPRF